MFIFYLETPDGVNNVFFERQARIFCFAKVMLNLVGTFTRVRSRMPYRDPHDRSAQAHGLRVRTLRRNRPTPCGAMVGIRCGSSGGLRVRTQRRNRPTLAFGSLPWSSNGIWLIVNEALPYSTFFAWSSTKNRIFLKTKLPKLSVMLLRLVFCYVCRSENNSIKNYRPKTIFRQWKCWF